MAQQKSEDRVVPDGGVMPVQPSGGGACGQGKAVPVEQTVVQLALRSRQQKTRWGPLARNNLLAFSNEAVLIQS